MRISLLLLLVIITYPSCSPSENSDNDIYIPGRTFQYEVTLADSSGTVTQTLPLELTATGEYFVTDRQTGVTWKLYNATGDSITHTEKTGVVDDGDYYYVRQPRMGDLYILSFAPFPSITLSDIQHYGMGKVKEGAMVMSRTYKDMLIEAVATRQKTIEKTSLTLRGTGTRVVFRNLAIGTSKAGTITGHYYFDEELGFVKMDYQLPDNSRITLEMIGKNF